MFKHWMKIVHNRDNYYLGWLFHQNVFPLRESTSLTQVCYKGLSP